MAYRDTTGPYGPPVGDPWWKQGLETAVPIATAALSTGGDIYANQKNIELAREQMAFQERMSNTAAQRSVKDYEAAGLNPALAYDRSASSPGGASTTIGNPVASGISSALSAKNQLQAMNIAKQQNIMDLNLKNAQREKAAQEASLTRTQNERAVQDMNFAKINQPYMMRNNAAEAMMKELLLPGLQNQAKFDQMMGQVGPGLNSAKSLLSALDLMSKMIVRHQ